jgi:hypothetical protein
MIIQRTLSEIREIEGTSPGAEKTAAQQSSPRQAAFIKAALEAGHDAESIAKFLDQASGARPEPAPAKVKKSATTIIG